MSCSSLPNRWYFCWHLRWEVMKRAICVSPDRVLPMRNAMLFALPEQIVRFDFRIAMRLHFILLWQLPLTLTFGFLHSSLASMNPLHLKWFTNSLKTAENNACHCMCSMPRLGESNRSSYLCYILYVLLWESLNFWAIQNHMCIASNTRPHIPGKLYPWSSIFLLVDKLTIILVIHLLKL